MTGDLEIDLGTAIERWVKRHGVDDVVEALDLFIINLELKREATATSSELRT